MDILWSLPGVLFLDSTQTYLENAIVLLSKVWNRITPQKKSKHITASFIRFKLTGSSHKNDKIGWVWNKIHKKKMHPKKEIKRIDWKDMSKFFTTTHCLRLLGYRGNWSPPFQACLCGEEAFTSRRTGLPSWPGHLECARRTGWSVGHCDWKGWLVMFNCDDAVGMQWKSLLLRATCCTSSSP